MRKGTAIRKGNGVEAEREMERDGEMGRGAAVVDAAESVPLLALCLLCCREAW